MAIVAKNWNFMVRRIIVNRPYASRCLCTFVVAPSRVLLESFTENRELEGENVAIDCPLRFGKLRDGWSVEWTVKDSQGNTMHPSEYFNRTNPKFQLVIKKASFDYEEATFVCQALRGHTIYQESQTITLNLFRKLIIVSLCVATV